MRSKMYGNIIKVIDFGRNITYKKGDLPKHLLINENISYIEDNEEYHKLDIIYPNNKMEKYPFILNIHGGGFCMNSKNKIYRDYGVRLASNKYAVVNMNYRLANQAYFPAQIEDVLSVITFIKMQANKYHLDINNMFVIGDSAGAYMAAMTACITNDSKLKKYYNFDIDIKIQAIALNCGMYDFSTLLYSDISFPLRKQMLQVLFGKSKYEELSIFQYTSVLKYINTKFPPAYIMDTEKKSFDKETIRLEKVLLDNKIEYKKRIFHKDEQLPHAFNIGNSYLQSMMVMEEIFDFFDNYIDITKDSS